jgi:hypothetical protein
MLRPALFPTSAVLWLVAVLGAAALLIGPITPWCLPVELVGLGACALGSAASAAWFLR